MLTKIAETDKVGGLGEIVGQASLPAGGRHIQKLAIEASFWICLGGKDLTVTNGSQTYLTAAITDHAEGRGGGALWKHQSPPPPPCRPLFSLLVM
jgi:hypothetical protein